MSKNRFDNPMTVKVMASVTYACHLDEEQAKSVKKYAEKHGVSLLEAVGYLYFNTSKLDSLYAHSTESDFSTDEFLTVSEDDYE